MTSRRIFFHVGTGKTGSSAIQYSLMRSAGDLERQGYSYPDLGRNFKRLETGFPTGGNGASIARALRAGNIDWALHLVKSIPDAPGHLVVSNEGLFKASGSAWREFCSALRDIDYEPKCLIFFRPQFELGVSGYVQSFKNGRGTEAGLAAFATQLKYRDWFLHAQRLERAFDFEHLTVKWYPSVLRNGGVVEAVFQWLGMEAPNTPVPQVNPTPGVEAFCVMQALQQIDLGGRRFFDRFLIAARDQNLLGSRMTLDANTARIVHDATKASNEMLLRRYCLELSPDEELTLPEQGERPPIDESVVERLRVLAADMLTADGIDKKTIEGALSFQRSPEV